MDKKVISMIKSDSEFGIPPSPPPIVKEPLRVSQAKIRQKNAVLVAKENEEGTGTYLPVRYLKQKRYFAGVSLKDLVANFPTATGLYVLGPNKEKIRLARKYYIQEERRPGTKKTTKDVEVFIVWPTSRYGWDAYDIYYVDYVIREKITIALCLSGGGFRATMFHLGALRRLNELGILKDVNTISSVSGGSIMSGILASTWEDLAKNNWSDEAFENLVAKPTRLLCDENYGWKIAVGERIRSILRPFFGRLLKQTHNDNALAAAYQASISRIEQHLSKEHSEEASTVTASFSSNWDQPLSKALPTPGPNRPHFVFCATDMRNGGSIYFTQKSVGSELYGAPGKGEFAIPVDESQDLATKITLVEAISASSAFPMAFPAYMLHCKQNEIPISDGGLYDNVGMDPVLIPNIYADPDGFPHDIIFVSDAGSPFQEHKVSLDLVGTATRAFGILGAQAGKLREKLLKQSYESFSLYGAFWSLADLKNYSELLEKENLGEDLTQEEQETVSFINGKKDYPNIENLCKASSIAEFRTDVNQFYKEEKDILETTGYTLAAYRFRRYCADLFKKKELDKVAGARSTREFNPQKKAIYNTYLAKDSKEIDKILQTSNSMFIKDFHLGDVLTDLDPFWRILEPVMTRIVPIIGLIYLIILIFATLFLL